MKTEDRETLLVETKGSRILAYLCLGGWFIESHVELLDWPGAGPTIFSPSVTSSFYAHYLRAGLVSTRAGLASADERLPGSQNELIDIAGRMDPTSHAEMGHVARAHPYRVSFADVATPRVSDLNAAADTPHHGSPSSFLRGRRLPTTQGNSVQGDDRISVSGSSASRSGRGSRRSHSASRSPSRSRRQVSTLYVF